MFYSDLSLRDLSSMCPAIFLFLHKCAFRSGLIFSISLTMANTKFFPGLSDLPCAWPPTPQPHVHFAVHPPVFVPDEDLVPFYPFLFNRRNTVPTFLPDGGIRSSCPLRTQFGRYCTPLSLKRPFFVRSMATVLSGVIFHLYASAHARSQTGIFFLQSTVSPFRCFPCSPDPFYPGGTPHD